MSTRDNNKVKAVHIQLCFVIAFLAAILIEVDSAAREIYIARCLDHPSTCLDERAGQ